MRSDELGAGASGDRGAPPEFRGLAAITAGAEGVPGTQIRGELNR